MATPTEQFETCKAAAIEALDNGDNYVDVFNTFVECMSGYTHPSINMGFEFIENGMITNSSELKQYLNKVY